MKQKKWQVAEGNPATEKIFCDKFDIPHVVARILMNRGVTDIETAELFLNPSLTRLENPLAMADMDLAVNRILRALDTGEKVVIYGDYDVDGITSTVLLVSFFTDIGIHVDYYIPERGSEGYGLNVKAVEKLASEGTKLLVTVDNGINAFTAAKRAAELGVDLLITDHHLPEQKLPIAVAILDPHRADCKYPFKGLAGVGVAFKLATAVRNRLHERGVEKQKLPNLKRLLDFVAIGSIADAAKLLGENRIMARVGIDELSKTKKAGLLAIKKVAGLNGTATCKDIGFGIAPRLNAAGRLGRADICVELLLTEDPHKAREIALKLDDENNRRKTTQAEVFKTAMQLADDSFDPKNERLLVLGADGWNAGVVGIVASLMVEKFGVPVALVCFDGEMGKGSARSIPAFNMNEGLHATSSFLERFGGHKMAAGFSVRRDNFDKFKEALLTFANEKLTDEDTAPLVNIDLLMSLDEITIELIEQINSLAPFGEGFKMPIFASRSVPTKSFRVMGPKGQHVKFTLENGSEAIGFNMAESLIEKGAENQPMDIAYTPEINRWRGTEKIQLRLIDARPAK